MFITTTDKKGVIAKQNIFLNIGYFMFEKGPIGKLANRMGNI
jgi:hypothetical protein